MLIKILYKKFPKVLFFFRKITLVNKEAEMQLLPILCHEQMTSLDVGAKFGMYTYRLNQYSKKVVAFEPIEALNIALSNIFKRCSVDIMPLALSETSGEISMRTPLYKSGNPCYGRSTIEKNNPLEFEEIKGWEEFTIKTARLDDLLIENVGFIKIDVEGHEQAVLDGALLTIQKYKPAFLIEANNSHSENAIEKLFHWAKDNSYLVFFMNDNLILPASKFDVSYHHHQLNMENFILIHDSDTERLQKLALFP
ncbi:hypothetical protein MNBD_ALPHA03-1733 [hydrothermal vent metagenome]|uniref:Methyltransferase FkbM domain-containing protein n=1 Tax=hydrothermal vent metagenome TaxID=652676 RepID=A0A3B1AMV5_9ZZZZ